MQRKELLGRTKRLAERNQQFGSRPKQPCTVSP